VRQTSVERIVEALQAHGVRYRPRRLSRAEKLRWLEEAQGWARRLTDRRSPDAVHEPGPPAGEERTDDDAQH
jgi:hypothetical protein